MKEYGVLSYKFGDDEKESTIVQFGDGLTAIQALGYDNGDVGVVLCRDGNHTEPFCYSFNGDTYKSTEDKVFIAFDNPKSIDALILKLNEAKGWLIAKK